MSSSSSIYLRVFHSCTILTLYFFYLSFDSPHGQMFVTADLYIAQGRRSEGKFDFLLFVLTPAYINLTLLLPYYYYKGEEAQGPVRKKGDR